MEQKRPKVKNPTAMVTIHIVVICYVAYLFVNLLRGYLAGGEGAPNLGTVIIGGVVLLGGATYVGITSYKLYRQCKDQKDND